MEVDLWFKLAAILVLLALSAFFSSMESAYFSLSRSALDRLRDSSDPRAKRAAKLMDDPRRLLATILTGNTVVNTAAAAVAALLAVRLAAVLGIDPNLLVTVEVVVFSAIVLFFAELGPKLFALRNPESWATKTSGGLTFARVVFAPFAVPLSLFTTNLSRWFGIQKQNVLAMSEEEIRAIVDVGHEHGVLELEERQMIHSIFEFGDTIAREVMVPRIDIVSVEHDAPLQEILEVIGKHGHSRIPVYSRSIDNITGLIHAKDLLAVTMHPERFELKDHLRPAYFVPEEKKIDDLLREFQSAKVHMAIVVDEYGGTAGLVTMEDIIEEIVGEIQDEYDKEQPLARRIDDDTLLANGRIGIYDFNEMQGFALIPDTDAYDTLAGFVYSQLGYVPKKGEGFEFQGYRFIVEEVHGKRITRVKVIKDKSVLEDV